MPKVSKTPKRAQRQQDDEIQENIFDALAEYSPQGPSGSPAPTSQQAAAPEPTVADLMKLIGEQNERIRRQEEAQLALLTNPPSTHQFSQAVPQQQQEAELPDPIQDPVGYGNELQARIYRKLAADREHDDRNKQMKDSQSQALTNLWEDFAIAYPAYADDTERVEYVAAKVAQKAKARNIDLNRYMFGNQDRFMRDLTAEFDRLFGAPGEVDEVEDEAPARRQTRQREEPETHRTGGLFGGMESGSKPVGGKLPPGDMIRDIHEIQRKSGFY